MFHKDIVEAISNLDENAKYHLFGEDLENIEWFSDPIPVKEITDEIALLPQKRLEAKNNAIAAKAAAEAKLAALGLTADDLKALGL